MSKESEEFGWEKTTEDFKFFSDEELGIKKDDNTGDDDPKKDDDDLEIVKEGDDVVTPEEQAVIDSLFNEGDDTPPAKGDDNDDEPEGKNTPASKEGKKKEKSTQEMISDIRLVNSLKERGLLDFELEDGAEMTAELAEEILEDDYDNRIANQVEDLFKDLPDEVKNMNKFIMQGGTMAEYIQTLQSQKPVGVTRGMDLTVEANQEAIVSNQLRQDGFDDEYVKSQLQYLKDSGMLEKTANTHYGKWEIKDKAAQKALLESQEAQRRAAKEQKKQEKRNVSDYVKGTDSIKGFKISRNDKKELPGYMTEKSVKLDNGAEMTPMHRDLYAAMSDPENSVLLAKLLRNGLDFKKLKQAAVTEKTTDIKKNVRRSNNSTPSASTGVSSRKTLAELLAE
jgi:hypothetical protein